MWTVGLIGGVASGKSTVSEMLVSFGACVIEADIIAHEVLQLPEICQQMRARWVASKRYDFADVFCTDFVDFHYGSRCNLVPDRRKIGKIVFNNPDELEFLEDIMQGIVGERIKASHSRYHREHTTAVVLDIPLLIKRSYALCCHHILFVDAKEEERVVRYANRQNQENGNNHILHKGTVPQSTWDDLKSRDKHLGLCEEWKSRSQVHVIDNNGTYEETVAQVKLFWETKIQGGTFDAGGSNSQASARVDSR